jgi:hypothetical protein
MSDKDLNTQGVDNNEISDQGKKYDERHESRLLHIIHEIEDEVKQIFDIDSFVHTGGNITGGITGSTEAESMDDDAES